MGSTFKLNITGDCNVGAFAFGANAVAVGSVTGSQSKPSKTDCGHCGAPIKKNCEACPYCSTDYSRAGKISIEIED